MIFSPVLRRLRYPTVILALTLPLLGCVSPARRLEAPTIAQIQDGVWTQAVVEKRFGKPREVFTGPNGRTVAHYWYLRPVFSYEASDSHRHLHPGDVLTRTLSVLYDASGRVEKHLLNEELTRVTRDERYLVLGRFISDDQLSQIRNGETTGEELSRIFGPPTSVTLDVDGSTLMQWVYRVEHEEHRLPHDRQDLYVSIDGEGKVKDYRVRGNPKPPPRR